MAKIHSAFLINFVFLVTISIFIFGTNISPIQFAGSPGGDTVITFQKGGCGDYNDDGVVDLTDAALFKELIGLQEEGIGFNDMADFNDDHIIDELDQKCMGRFLGQTLNCPEDSVYCGCGKGCADFYPDGTVDSSDTSLFLNYLNSSLNDISYNLLADFDRDGNINSWDQDCLVSFNGVETNCYDEYADCGCADFNYDGFVDVSDTSLFVSYLDSRVGDNNYIPLADFDGNGIINDEDSDCLSRYNAEELDCPYDASYCGCGKGCADLTGDGIVDISDNSLFSEIYHGGPDKYIGMADFDNDGVVDSWDQDCFTSFVGVELDCNIGGSNGGGPGGGGGPSGGGSSEEDDDEEEEEDDSVASGFDWDDDDSSGEAATKKYDLGSEVSMWIVIILVVLAAVAYIWARSINKSR